MQGIPDKILNKFINRKIADQDRIYSKHSQEQNKQIKTKQNKNVNKDTLTSKVIFQT